MMLLMLGLASALTIVTAQDAPKLPEAKNAPAAQVTPAGNSQQTATVATQLAGDYEKFPECRLYKTSFKPFDFQPNFEALIDGIDSMSSVAAFYDKNTSKFDPKQDAGKDIVYDLLVWDGYLPIKKAGTYTFLVTGDAGISAILVNGKGTTHICKQGTLDVDLKVGMNKLRFCIYTTVPDRCNKPILSYKLRNAIGDFREFTPANLSHKVENEEW